MKRNYILPSEILNRFEHDCRADSTKFKYRNVIHDTSVFAKLMSHTRSSINLFYDNTLYHPEADLADAKTNSTNNSFLSRRYLLKLNYLFYMFQK